MKVAVVNMSRHLNLDEWHVKLDTAETLQALIDYDEFANVNALNMYNKYSM